jgi:TRAP-type C4-dicarboxylate transport system permease small subunit
VRGRLGTWRRQIERVFEWITSALLVILALEVLLGIGFRAARRPLAWYDEVASVLLAWLTYYGSALAALKNAHIGFPGLANSLDRPGRVVVLVVREAAVLGFFAVLAWDETLVTVDIPVAVTQSVIPVGAILFIVAELLNLPDRIAWAQKRPSAAAGPEPAKELSH